MCSFLVFAVLMIVFRGQSLLDLFIIKITKANVSQEQQSYENIKN